MVSGSFIQCNTLCRENRVGLIYKTVLGVLLVVHVICNFHMRNNPSNRVHQLWVGSVQTCELPHWWSRRRLVLVQGSSRHPSPTQDTSAACSSCRPCAAEWSSVYNCLFITIKVHGNHYVITNQAVIATMYNTADFRWSPTAFNPQIKIIVIKS